MTTGDILIYAAESAAAAAFLSLGPRRMAYHVRHFTAKGRDARESRTFGIMGLTIPVALAGYILNRQWLETAGLLLAIAIGIGGGIGGGKRARKVIGAKARAIRARMVRTQRERSRRRPVPQGA